MLIMALKPGHDGSVAVVRDGKLLYALESEKDSFPRYAALTPMTMLDVAERVGDIPDVVALGGWDVQGRPIGGGYDGMASGLDRPMTFFGKRVRFFTSSHERSHVMMAIGMAPRGNHPLQAVLVWEGWTGAFYLVDDQLRVRRHIPVMTEPGARYAFLFALADPAFPDSAARPRLGDAGKLMALAAFARPEDADGEITDAVERILKTDTVHPVPKAEFRDTPLYNAGVESAAHKAAAALLTSRLFEEFARAATDQLPPGIPLRISGGCGLNCDWNSQWASLGHFCDVFVPPCANDAGSAIGTAIDALAAATGDPAIDWTVYAGLDFVNDTQPDVRRWRERALDYGQLAGALAQGRIVAWVQERWEIGPRALGNRSILAEPFLASTRDRLNTIKKRETYRPIAPCCRVEDLATVFDDARVDPYMLYFRRVRSPRYGAIRHVDGSARVQTVSPRSNARLHRLLTAFAERSGVGMLCNTSLNLPGHGFINKLSDLAAFCEDRGISDMVVADRWYQTRVGSGR